MTPPDAEGQLDINKALTDNLVTHQNIGQELVITTVDKLKLCLMEHEDKLRSRREWIAPAGILVALVTTLVAADFKDSLGLPAATWYALYLLAALLALVLTVVLVIRALLNLKESGIDRLIDKIAARRQAAARAYSAAYSAALSAMMNSTFLEALGQDEEQDE